MKTKILIVSAILVVSGVYFSVPAFAAPIQVRVCPRIAANFGDTVKLPPDAVNDVWGFHYSDNTVEKRLFGTRIRVYRITGPGSAVTLYDDYTAMNDGCTDEFTADSTVTYEIDLWPMFWHREKNLKLHVMTVTPGDTGRYYHPAKRQAQLQAGANVVKGFPASDAWDAYLALHLGLANITLGLQNQDLKAYLDEGCWKDIDDDPDVVNYQHQDYSCYGDDRVFSAAPYEDVLHLAPSSRRGNSRAFIILHELGHMLLSKYVGGFISPMGAYDDPKDGALGGLKCDYPSFANPGPVERSHQWNSMENSAAALSEGWAHFYAAAVLNRGRLNRTVDDTQCNFVYYKNIDLDDAVDAMGNPTTDQVPPNDWQGFLAQGVGIDNLRRKIPSPCNIPDLAFSPHRAWMENKCTKEDRPDGSQSYAGYGSEVDWLTTFWHVYMGSVPHYNVGSDDPVGSISWTRTPAATIAQILKRAMKETPLDPWNQYNDDWQGVFVWNSVKEAATHYNVPAFVTVGATTGVDNDLLRP